MAVRLTVSVVTTAAAAAAASEREKGSYTPERANNNNSRGWCARGRQLSVTHDELCENAVLTHHTIS